MALSEKESNQIKEKIILQIDSSFPENKKENAKQQIQAMDNPQLEEFLKQNKILTEGSEVQSQQSPFRLIIEEKIPSHKIDENQDAVAILEINPISKGHVIIIPRNPVDTLKKISKTIFSLAEEISKKIKLKLKPKEVKISPVNVLGEFIINVLPIYKNESLDSERHKAEESELLDLQGKLKEKPKLKTIKKPRIKKITGKKMWLPKRIP